jgi:hypothetical protein
MGRVCSTNSREEQFMQIFGGKPEGSRPLGRPRSRWEDSITVKFKVNNMKWRELGPFGSG